MDDSLRESMLGDSPPVTCKVKLPRTANEPAVNILEMDAANAMQSVNPSDASASPASSKMLPLRQYRPESSFRSDEGFADESLDDADSALGLDPRTSRSTPTREMLTQIDRLAETSGPNDIAYANLTAAVELLNEPQRREFACQILKTLRTSSIASIVELLTPLLHIDPVTRLPFEIIAQILAYLPAQTLLDTAILSRAWQQRALDSRLWETKYLAEGWTLNRRAIQAWEDEHLLAHALQAKGSPSTLAPSRKRSAPDSDAESSPEQDQQMSDGVDTSTESTQDAAMEGRLPFALPTDFRPDLQRSETMQVNISSRGDEEEENHGNEDLNANPSQVASPQLPSSHTQARLAPRRPMHSALGDTLAIIDEEDRLRLNYYFLYKQRRRLEASWLRGSYTPFQLPRPDHPEEAHTECVYTIQYNDQYLVSGSRDKTLRIWDLKTQRLVKRPLTGHKGSILCLQFDASPAEDLIASGSSDCDVILWRFSTGKKIQRLVKAHKESILNLKFDHRFLVTCSKDKLIKVWSREALRPGDTDYPCRGRSTNVTFPDYIVDAAALPDPRTMTPRLEEQPEPLPPYSLLMCISEHYAAVNAVYIYRDQLVSASGDRNIKVYDIHTGDVTALCKGHVKGIACVQYDGRRIVSGSSDNTIRVFDPASQAEVACLSGHKKLVRAVQASFGDAPDVEDADLAAEAFEADQNLIAALARISTSNAPSPTRDRVHRARNRNSGSRRSQDMLAAGARLPPGGGGHPRWARIVSGSYDETVIVWRKDADGQWHEHLNLKEIDILQRAGPRLVANSERRERAATEAARAQEAARILSARQQAYSDRLDLQQRLLQQAAQGATLIQANWPGSGLSSAMSQQANDANETAASSHAPVDTADGVTPERTLAALQYAAQQVRALQRSMPSGLSNRNTGQVDPGIQQQEGLNLSTPVQAGPSTLPVSMPNGGLDMDATPVNQASATAAAMDHIQNTGADGTGGGPASLDGASVERPAQSSAQVPLPFDWPFETLDHSTLSDSSTLRDPAWSQRWARIDYELQLQRLALQNQRRLPNSPSEAELQAAQTMLSDFEARLLNEQQQAARVEQQLFERQRQLQLQRQQEQEQQQRQNARVFKLQFDARRIVCCSQDPKIVGWDFANGDANISRASAFFGAPQ